MFVGLKPGEEVQVGIITREPIETENSDQ